jgi:glutamate synthase domain-containing protein 2/glutamate synthase domain-containing protein 3/glutamate synthase domain-containing protein 1/NADPH-dependent glutamate synthase beta subunit-like oxidoreductase
MRSTFGKVIPKSLKNKETTNAAIQTQKTFFSTTPHFASEQNAPQTDDFMVSIPTENYFAYVGSNKATQEKTVIDQMHEHNQEHGACGTGITLNLNRKPTRAIVTTGLQRLADAEYRAGSVFKGQVDENGRTLEVSDGAGIRFYRLPVKFFQKCVNKGQFFKPDSSTPAEINLAEDKFAIGQYFFPQDDEGIAAAKLIVEENARNNGLELLGWRSVDCHINENVISEKSFALKPSLWQAIIVSKTNNDLEAGALKSVSGITNDAKTQGIKIHVCSQSSEGIVYKGMIPASKVGVFYEDLRDKDFDAEGDQIHTRYGTNVGSSWAGAQPFRVIAHNGEMNSRAANAKEMLEEQIKTGGMSADMNLSDSNQFDDDIVNQLNQGKSLAEAFALLMPPSIADDDPDYSDEVKSMLKYFRLLRTPYNGPAFVNASHKGDFIFKLDSVGLRPSRWALTKDSDGNRQFHAYSDDDLKMPRRNVSKNGNLGPGDFLMITKSGEILHTKEVLAGILKTYNDKGVSFVELLKKHVVALDALAVPVNEQKESDSKAALRVKCNSAFWDAESTLDVIIPMALQGAEKIGAMGNDTSVLPSLKGGTPLHISYLFHQLFAQVSAPPIDSVRELASFNLTTTLGGDVTRAPDAKVIGLKTPILAEDILHKIEHQKNVQTHLLDITFPMPELLTDGSLKSGKFADNMKDAIKTMLAKAEESAKLGGIIILSDRNTDATRAMIPDVIAVAAVKKHLEEKGISQNVSIVCDSYQITGPHHASALLTIGARAVYPRGAYEKISELVKHDPDFNGNVEEYYSNYQHGLEKSLLKTMGKVGIIDFNNYSNGGFLAAMGLDFTRGQGKPVAENLTLSNIFKGIYSPVKGLKLEDIAVSVIHNHVRAYANTNNIDLPVGHFRPESDGIAHGFGPVVVNAFTNWMNEEKIRSDKLRIRDIMEQKGIDLYDEAYTPESGFLDPEMKNSEGFYPPEYLEKFRSSEAFKKFSADVAKYREKNPTSIYDMLEVNPKKKPERKLDISEVESIQSILSKIYMGDMSQGALTIPAHKTITQGANAVGAISSSGEGGQNPADIEHPLRGTKSNQIASGRFGVSAKQIRSAKVVGVKEAQGAKPGEGGEAPGEKMIPEYAAQRGGLPGLKFNSLTTHSTKFSIEDTEGLIYYIESVLPNDTIEYVGSEVKDGSFKPAYIVSEKIVSIPGIGTIANGLAKGRAGEINVAGNSGGTGAANLSSIKNTGMPSEIGLAEVDVTLRESELRDQVKLRTSGGFKTAEDIIKAAINGADGFEFGSMALLPVGCKMQRTCNKSCEPGVATDADKFKGEQINVERYLVNVAASVQERLQELGIATLAELRGRTDLLRVIDEKMAEQFDFSLILSTRKPITPNKENPVVRAERLKRKDDIYVQRAKEEFASGKKIFETEIIDVEGKDRAFGARFAGEMYSYLEKNPDCQAILHTQGNAGQGFGFVNPKGVSIIHNGPVQDGCGECMSGGEIIVKTPEGNADFNASENTIAGNALGYGMSGGELYVNGRAGHRSGILLKGGTVVVEGAGVYAFEFMTSGTAMVLGKVGKGFGAGSSGGIIFAYDDKKSLKTSDSVRQATQEEQPAYTNAIRTLLNNHYEKTGSTKARKILDNFDKEIDNFQILIPKEMDKIKTVKKLADVYKTYNLRETPICVGMQVWLEQKSLEIIRGLDSAKINNHSANAQIQALSDFTKIINNPENKVPLQDATKIELLQKAKKAERDIARTTPIEYLGLNPLFLVPFYKEEKAVSTTRPIEERLSSVSGIRDEKFADIFDNIDLYAEKLGKEGGGCSGCGAQSCAGVGAPTGCSAEKPINTINAKLKKLGQINGNPTTKQWHILREAFEFQISKTPFIAFTGAACPAPCEDACTESIPEDGMEDSKRAGKKRGQPVQIKNIEYLLYNLGRNMGWFEETKKLWSSDEAEKVFGGDFQKRIYDKQMQGFQTAFSKPKELYNKEVVIIGSGPAAMEIAHRALKDGVQVRMYERSDKPGGLLMDGIPAHKFDKEIVDWHFDQLEYMGLELHLNSEVKYDKATRQFKINGTGEVIADDTNKNQHVVLCPGAGKPRELPAEITESLPQDAKNKIVQAVDFLKAANDVAYAKTQNPELDIEELIREKFGNMDPRGKKIIVIGGGDTAQDAIRNTAKYFNAFNTTDSQSIEVIVREEAKKEERGILDGYPHASKVLKKENKLRDQEIEAIDGKMEYLVEPEKIELNEDDQLQITLRHSKLRHFDIINSYPEAKKLYEKLPAKDKVADVIEYSQSTGNMVICALGFEGKKSIDIVNQTHGAERVYIAGDASETQNWIIIGAQKSGGDTYTNKVKPALELELASNIQLELDVKEEKRNIFNRE